MVSPSDHEPVRQLRDALALRQAQDEV